MTAIRKTIFVLTVGCAAHSFAATCDQREILYGRKIFEAKTLSSDGKTSCATCHDPLHNFATNLPVAVGVGGTTGTRNAPSLNGVGDNTSFFWDGRRSSLEESVLDAFTNPVELDLPSNEQLLEKVKQARLLPNWSQTSQKGLSTDLSCYLRSLNTHTSRYDRYVEGREQLNKHELLGLKLFKSVAGCESCHRMDQSPATFTDNAFHHSGVQQDALEKHMGSLAADIVQQNLPVESLGKKTLSDALWSAAGRFVVTHDPKDIGSFRTPSLRNVAQTGPYMHDGSVATLREAVDREIYYRAFSTGNTINLTEIEREEIVDFLGTLSEAKSAP